MDALPAAPAILLPELGLFDPFLRVDVTALPSRWDRLLFESIDMSGQYESTNDGDLTASHHERLAVV
jgi:urate oxidase